jgi:serine/threonine-protein kinase
LKIADFGIAKLLGANAEDTALTGSHHVMGTPHYMAPEQLAHPLEVDHRADIFSLGVVFYEMLTGDLPVGRFVPPSQKVQVDVRIDDVVLRTLEQERERRYQHVSEIKSDVETIATGDAAGLSAAKSAKIDGQIEHQPRSHNRTTLKRLALGGRSTSARWRGQCFCCWSASFLRFHPGRFWVAGFMSPPAIWPGLTDAHTPAGGSERTNRKSWRTL